MKKRLAEKKIKKEHNLVLDSVKKRYRLKKEEFIENKVRNTLQKDSSYRIGANSICQFEVKGIVGWKFGLWLKQDGSFSFIGEYKKLISRFEPNKTYITRTIENSRDVTEKVLNLLEDIKRHPKNHFVKACANADLPRGVTADAIYEQHFKGIEMKEEALDRADGINMPVDKDIANEVIEVEISGNVFHFKLANGKFALTEDK